MILILSIENDFTTLEVVYWLTFYKVRYKVLYTINAGYLKVTWDLKSSKSLDSYNYVLKIKLNNLPKQLQGNS